MIIKETIKESNVAQGDLVFIYHRTKPSKTGWWRKIREGSTDNKVIYYVLEKPMHKEFDIEHESMTSHVENGFCVMTDRTLKSGIDEHKYEILADVRGTDSIALSLRGFQLNDMSFTCSEKSRADKDNIIITEKFKKLIDLYKPRKKASEIETLANNLI